jgi:hypothetical protein
MVISDDNKTKESDTKSKLLWSLFKQTGLFIVKKIPTVIQMATSALIFRQFIKANRIQTLEDMDKLRKHVVNVDMKVRENLLNDVSLQIKPLIEDMIQPLLDRYFSHAGHLKQMAQAINEIKQTIENDGGNVEKVFLSSDNGELQSLISTIDSEISTHIARKEVDERERESVVAKWTETLSEVATTNIVRDMLVQDLGLTSTQASSIDVINERVFKAKNNKEKFEVCVDLAQKLEHNSLEIAQYCADSLNARMDDIDNGIEKVTGVKVRLFRSFKSIIGTGFFERGIKQNSHFLSILMVQHLSNIQFISFAIENGMGMPSSHSHFGIGNGGSESFLHNVHHGQLQLLPPDANDDMFLKGHRIHEVDPTNGA